MAYGWGVRYSGVTLREVSRDLRRMNEREVAGRFRRELRAAAIPLVPAVRASIARIPSTGGVRRAGGTLRGELSKAVRLEVRTVGPLAGVSIRVDGRRMPGREGKLPAYEEGTAAPWRHPVFGHTAVWVQQAAHPYFYKVVVPLGLTSRVAVNRAIDSITRGITGRGFL